MAANHQQTDQDPTYTFEWRRDGKRIKTSHVPRSQLWTRFNQAADWARADPRRSVSYYGPQIMRVLVGEYARDRLRYILEPLGLVPQGPHYIALLWADLGQGYALNKVEKKTEQLDGFERPHTVTHALVPVNPGDVRGAFVWARQMSWRASGVWINDKPALLFCGVPFESTARALRDLPQVAPLLHEGRVILAPAAYDWDGVENDYPFIKPTRGTRAIHDHRARWPTAPDVKWTPKDVLIDRYGYGMRGREPALALAL